MNKCEGAEKKPAKFPLISVSVSLLWPDVRLYLYLQKKPYLNIAKKMINSQTLMCEDAAAERRQKMRGDETGREERREVRRRRRRGDERRGEKTSRHKNGKKAGK